MYEVIFAAVIKKTKQKKPYVQDIESSRQQNTLILCQNERSRGTVEAVELLYSPSSKILIIDLSSNSSF